MSKKLSRAVRTVLADWPAGETRGYDRVYSFWRTLETEAAAPYVRPVKGATTWATGYQRTDVPIARPRLRTTSTGAWPWPVPYHQHLIATSPFAQHLDWAEQLGGDLSDSLDSFRAPLRHVRRRTSRLVSLRDWMQRGGAYLPPVWLTPYAGSEWAKIWCALLLVRPEPQGAGTWHYKPLDPEHAKVFLLSHASTTFSDALTLAHEHWCPDLSK